MHHHKQLFLLFVQQLYSSCGESRSSSAGPEEQHRHGGAAPSTGRQTEGQEAKHEESQEERQSCQAPQTVSQDGPAQTQPEKEQNTRSGRTSASCLRKRACLSVNVMEGQSVQYYIDNKIISLFQVIFI